jgi:4-hydroxybutyryl-CoA dehydratase/vinylacetyl-CoA-Delta-isomerase
VDPDTGLLVPGLVPTNVAKFKFAMDSAESTQKMADICGGIISTVPAYKDWMSLEERPLIERYLAGKSGIPTEHRLRVIRLAKDMASHNHDQTAIHAEGSPEAQKIALYASGDWARYKAAARRAAGIPGWEEHPLFKDLPELSPKDSV